MGFWSYGPDPSWNCCFIYSIQGQEVNTQEMQLTARCNIITEKVDVD